MIKARLYRYMFHSNEKNWNEYLPIVVEHLNSRRLKSLGNLQPKNVQRRVDDELVREKTEFKTVPWREVKQNQLDALKNPNVLQPGTFVYVSVKKPRAGAFSRGFQLTDKIFGIVDTVDAYRLPILYTIKDLQLVRVYGSFVRESLLLAPNPMETEHFYLKKVSH